MRRRLLPLLVLLLLGAAAAAWWYDVPARLGWTAPEPGDAPLVLYGNVDIRQVELGFRVGGRVAAMAAEEGDEVETGEVLARLDPGTYKGAARAAEAEVASRKANLAKLQAGPREAEIAQARAVVAEREVELANAERAFERANRLRSGGSVSQATLDEARAAVDTATARLQSARAALELLEEGSRPEDIAVARASLEAAEANYETARTSLADTVLRAPAAGTILSRVREPGAIVSPGEPVYVMSLNEPVWVRTYVSEPYLGRIHPGMKVEVVTDTAPHRPYRGQVGFISPVAEFTPKSVETPELRTDLVYRLRIVVEAPDEGLRQGMPVTVRIPESGGAE